MEVLKSIREAKSFLASLDKRPSLIPTMGALHKAHSALMRRAAEDSSFIVSIFVNPAQFGPGEDYDTYPRSFDDDLRLCEEARAAAVFAPEVSEIYPEGFITKVSLSELTRSMCGAVRPGHFEGVATVVLKLFNIIRPEQAYFGQKDYQQCRVIERMIKDLNLDLEAVILPTVREEDGLAVSSRNRYLSEEERSQAPALYRALKRAALRVTGGETDAALISRELSLELQREMPLSRVDYAGLYSAGTLQPLREVSEPAVAAAAVFLGRARLIDNVLCGNK